MVLCFGMNKSIRYVPILQNGTFFDNTDFYYITAQCFHYILCIISVPEMLAQVESNTDPLAWKIADRPQLTLPEEYRIRIAQMQD